MIENRESEILDLKDSCERYKLSGREILDKFTPAELAAEYNGAGPDSWIPEAREILTIAMALFKPVVLIHDIQFAQSDGTDEGFARTVSDWRANTRKIMAVEYPLFTWQLFSKSYRLNLAYWTGVMEAANLAISTRAAKDAWIAAHNRRSQNNA